MKRLLVLLLLAIAVAGPAGAAPNLAVPDLQGPKTPALTPAVGVVTAFEEAEFSCASPAPRTATIGVPEAPWSRAILEFRARPVGDPWDRLFGVSIGGVEVLRGTTPRTDFTVRKDITEFASLLPPGGTAEVRLDSGSFVGKLLETVKIEFYAEPSLRTPARTIAPLVAQATLGG